MAEKQIAIYARVSSDQQVDEGTIESQVAALRERVEKDGQRLADELVFIDEGYSGANLIRPGLEQLRDVAALNGLDRLYVHSPDRLARRYAYQVLLMDEFQQAGIEVVFLNRELSGSPEDDLLLQVQGMIAEYERAKILERSRRGKRHAARSGDVTVLSGAPYGYHYVTKQEGGGQASYEVIPEEAQVVQQIFQWVGQERCSMREVCRRLQKAGVRTRHRKNHLGSLCGLRDAQEPRLQGYGRLWQNENRSHESVFTHSTARPTLSQETQIGRGFATRKVVADPGSYVGRRSLV